MVTVQHESSECGGRSRVPPKVFRNPEWVELTLSQILQQQIPRVFMGSSWIEQTTAYVSETVRSVRHSSPASELWGVFDVPDFHQHLSLASTRRSMHAAIAARTRGHEYWPNASDSLKGAVSPAYWTDV